MGLIVAQSIPGGSGTSKDGNTAHLFSKNPDISSDITGIEEELIQRFGIILGALSCGFSINTSEFVCSKNEIIFYAAIFMILHACNGT